MHETSALLHLAENELQIVALLFMATVYALKVRWILGFPAGRDWQPPHGTTRTDAQRGGGWSLFAIGMPWSMASTRSHPLLYAQFVVFHLAVAASIALSFVIPYAPGLLRGRAVVMGLQALFAAAALIGVARLIRRVSSPYLRAISSPDDYFSIVLLTVWFGFSVLAAPNDPQTGEWPLLAYFILTAFFLVYVPFSKISHYLYYPFARWYLGRSLGHRGVYPIAKGA
jgi:nitrate reductase gamma subunit